jgi:hypothetical protein
VWALWSVIIKSQSASIDLSAVHFFVSVGFITITCGNSPSKWHPTAVYPSLPQLWNATLRVSIDFKVSQWGAAQYLGERRT